MAKTKLTDYKLKALKAAPAGKTYDVMDSEVRGFGVRVSEIGRKTFILVRRFPGRSNPTRRAIGEYGGDEGMSLAEARDKAQDWKQMVRKGVDPLVDAEHQRIAEQRKQENSFRVVAEEFIQKALIGRDPEKPKQRKGPEAAQDIEREFIKRWAARPITSITARDILAVIDAKGRDHPAQAHNLLGHIRRLFNWAIARGVYGIDRSPCERMKPKEVIGKKTVRNRVLSDAEVRALWNATAVMSYPNGPLFRMLALTGQRKSEVAQARWSEFDLEKRLWTIPAERMKMDAAHVVPLTDEMITLLAELPRFSEGDYLFSTTYGVKPGDNFVNGKRRLDELMLAELGTLPPFVLHDIRRTMRTGLSALPIPDIVRELVIAHSKPGLHKVYDQHAYLDEKRRALELWAGRLRDIVTPPPANVVKLTPAVA